MLATAQTQTAPIASTNATSASHPTDQFVELFRKLTAACVADEKCREVVVDFEQFPAISSRLINELIRTHLELRLHDRTMRLVQVHPQVAEVLRLLRLDRTLPFTELLPCPENEQSSVGLKHRVDAAEKIPTFFLRRFASRTLSLLRHS